MIIMDIHKHFGLETLLRLEQQNTSCVNDVAILLAHWSLLKHGLLSVGLGEQVPQDGTRSEILPAGWNAEAGLVYSLVYQDDRNTGYLLKAISADEVLIMSLLSLKTKKTADTSIVTAEFIERNEEVVFNNLEILLSKIESELIAKVIDTSDQKGNKDTKKKSEEVHEKKDSEHDQDPLLMGGGRRGRVDPGMPDGGFLPNIGGADLDPFRGGIMGGGMLMDPRGSGRGLGGGVGPRWDPVGPGGPGGLGGLGPRPRGGGGLNNFGDEMAPPDWNNMYM